jgi:hypothetical protein
MSGTELQTPIRLPLRGWMTVEVLFGLAAISTVFLRPEDTANNFAWPIQPAVMAAVLGAFYLASALLFVLSFFARSWQQVRVMILPSAAFSTAMLLATFLHWDRFSVGTFPFLIWFASYVLPPPIFVALYVWHQRRAAPPGAGIEIPVVGWARTFFRINGGAVSALALVGFAAPGLLATAAPWDLTPLTTRALCGWLLAVGLLQVSMAWEGDWGRARLATSMLMVLPVGVLVQLGRFADQVDWGSPSLWVVLADFSAVAGVCGYLWATAGAGRPVVRPATVP